MSPTTRVPKLSDPQKCPGPPVSMVPVTVVPFALPDPHLAFSATCMAPLTDPPDFPASPHTLSHRPDAMRPETFLPKVLPMP